MEKDNKIILFAVIILLIAMFSYNELFFEKENFGKENEKSFGKVTGNVVTNQTIDKCFIKVAKWSSTSDKYTKISTVKQGQTVYMYIETNNCKNKNLNFEVFRLRKRLLLKDSLALVSNTVKTAPDLEKLSVSFSPVVNTEDSGSSTYKFRTRFTDLPSSNTTNQTISPPTNTTNQNATYASYANQIDWYIHWNKMWDRCIQKPFSDTIYLNNNDYVNEGCKVQFTVDLHGISLGDTIKRPDSDPFLYNHRHTVTRDGEMIYDYSYRNIHNILYNDSFPPSHGGSGGIFSINKSGNYCIKSYLDYTNDFIEIDETNNQNPITCLYINLLSSNSTSDLIIEKLSIEDNNGQPVTTLSIPQNITIKYTIKNIGTRTAYYTGNSLLFETKGLLTKDGYSFKQVGTTIQSIKPGESIEYGVPGTNTFRLKHYIDQVGTYCVEDLTADYNNVVQELNENNNKYPKTCFTAYNPGNVLPDITLGDKFEFRYFTGSENKVLNDGDFVPLNSSMQLLFYVRILEKISLI